MARSRGPSKAAQRKGGRAAARSRKSPIGRKKGSSTRSRRSSSTSRKSSSSRKSSGKFIQSAIKRPGALTARAKRGKKRSVHAQARHDMKHGTTLQKRQASFYLNVLKPASKRRKK